MLAALSFPHASYLVQDVCMADIRLSSLVYLPCLRYTYCVPIAHLRQNKPLPLLYLGHAQIIIDDNNGFLLQEKRVGYVKHPHLMPLYAFSEEKG